MIQSYFFRGLNLAYAIHLVISGKWNITFRVLFQEILFLEG